MLFIRQGATHKIVLGPAVAVGDGFTPVTTLSVATADEAEAILHDNGTVVDISGYTFAAITTADGYYHLTLQSGISGTVGHMSIVINDDSLILPLRADFTVLEEAAYDQIFAASAPGAATVAALATVDTVVDGIQADLDNGTDGLGAIKTETAAILADTAEIGAAGAGLTSLAQASVATEARLAELDAANLPTDVAAVKTDTGNLVTRITATLFSGITSLAEWLGLLAGKQAGDATALTEIKATGAGSGTYDPTTDSIEALRDTAPMGTAMRGTDSAALATVCTEARLSELDGTAGKAVAEIDLIKTDAAAILVDTGTTLDARIPAALVGGRMDSSVGAKAVGLALTAQEKVDVAAELATYDGPTRAEATADKDELLAQLPSSPLKNTALTYGIKMVLASDHVTPATGLTVTMTRSLDGAAFGAATGTVTELTTGHYKVAASAADMNGNVVMHRFAAATADDLTMEFFPVS